MHAVGGIPCQHQTPVDIAIGNLQRQRIRPTRPFQRQLTEIIAKTLFDFGQKMFIIQRHHDRRKIVGFGPDQR